jgi:hypothetical protein
MIPSQTRTGGVEIKEQGFTSYFSVDGTPHSFSTRYYDGHWRPFPDHLKRRLAQIVGSVWVASIPAEDKIFTHRLNEADIDMLKFIAYQTQGAYRKSMKYPALENRPTLHVTRDNHDWSDIELKTDDCGVYFSGGRDAFCTLGLLEEAGYTPHLQMHNNGSSWDAGELAREEFKERGRQVDTVWNNFSLLKREITKEHDIYWHLESPIFHMTFFESLPMLQQELMFFGNEATTTRYTWVGKDRIHHQSWEQSITATHLMTKWAQENGINLRVGSILREMGDYRVMKELTERYPDYRDLSRSCFFVNTDNEYEPCSKCNKDMRHWLALKAFGGPTDRYDEDRLREHKPDPSILMQDMLLPNDISHMNALTGGFFTDVPEATCPEVEGLMFKKDRSNPSRFLTRDEFKNIYQVVMDDDKCWLLFESGSSTTDLDYVYDVTEEWDIEQAFDYSVPVEENNSLLNI